MTPKRWSVLAGSLVIAVIGGWLLRPTPEPQPIESPPEPTARPEAVAALGQLRDEYPDKIIAAYAPQELGWNPGLYSNMLNAINDHAASDVRVAVVGNPCNTNCLIAMNSAPDVPNDRFSAMTRLDQNRAQAQLAQRAGVATTSVTNTLIWGNHSATQVPDYKNTLIDGRSAAEVIADPRVEASQDAYRQQGEMLTQIRSMLADIHQTVQQFRQVKTQLSGRLTALRGQTGSEALVQQGEAIVKQLAAWEQQLIQPSQKTFQDVINFPNRLNAQLVYLAGQLDTNDPQPTAGCQQRLADLTAQWTTEKAALEKIVAGPIAQFNQAYRAAELPALIIPDSNDK